MSEPASHPPGGDTGRAATAPAPGRGGTRRVASGFAVAIALLALALGGCWETESSPSARAPIAVSDGATPVAPW